MLQRNTRLTANTGGRRVTVVIPVVVTSQPCQCSHVITVQLGTWPLTLHRDREAATPTVLPVKLCRLFISIQFLILNELAPEIPQTQILRLNILQ